MTTKVSRRKKAKDNAEATATPPEPVEEQGKLPIEQDEEIVETELEVATPLHGEALLNSAQKMAGATGRIEDLEAEMKAYCEPRKKEITALRKEESKHAREVRTKSEWSTIPVLRVMHFPTNTVRFHRIDESAPRRLGEHLRAKDRAMTAEERKAATMAVQALPAGRVEAVEEDEE